jgi:hypothetical protein
MDDRSALAPDMPSRLDPFAAASRETREAGFTRGYAAGAPEACIPPDTLERDR